MTDQPPPILPYQAPTPATANFGTLAARASWLAPLAAVLLFVGALATGNFILCIGVAALSAIIGLVAGVVALVTMRRYGRGRILRPAIIGLCLNLALLVLLGFWVIGVLNGLAASVR